MLPRNRTFLLYGFNRTRDSLLALPKFKVEIATVAGILLAWPRIRGRVAMVYSIPTFRAILCGTNAEKGYGAPVRDIAGYYATLMTSGVPMDVIDDATLLSGRTSQFRVSLLLLCRRV